MHFAPRQGARSASIPKPHPGRGLCEVDDGLHPRSVVVCVITDVLYWEFHFFGRERGS